MSYYDGPVWNWFSLSYSSYAVLPRRALCSMPVEWQERFVKLMEEAREMLPEEALYIDYWVRAKDGKRFVSDPNVPYRDTGPWPLTQQQKGDET